MAVRWAALRHLGSWSPTLPPVGSSARDAPNWLLNLSPRPVGLGGQARERQYRGSWVGLAEPLHVPVPRFVPLKRAQVCQSITL